MTTPLNSGTVPAAVPADRYDEVLLPFLTLMRKELHANSRKGDRPGWLAMSANTLLLEVYWHTAKLSAAVKNNDGPAIMEHSADVANMAMMVLDVCSGLAFVDAAALATSAPPPVGAREPLTAPEQSAEDFVRTLLWDEFPDCCGQLVVGAEYMGQQEMICCGNPERSHLSDAKIVAALRERFTFCSYCGGNDENPPDHCMDCTRPLAATHPKEQTEAREGEQR